MRDMSASTPAAAASAQVEFEFEFEGKAQQGRAAHHLESDVLQSNPQAPPKRLDLVGPIQDFKGRCAEWGSYDESDMGVTVRHVER
ncbi:polynucleotide adenylyltransferase [Tilletia horrida]|nr:polynucleotide adenylyltransferase [Tilletia horrida]